MMDTKHFFSTINFKQGIENGILICFNGNPITFRTSIREVKVFYMVKTLKMSRSLINIIKKYTMLNKNINYKLNININHKNKNQKTRKENFNHISPEFTKF